MLLRYCVQAPEIRLPHTMGELTETSGEHKFVPVLAQMLNY